MAKVLLATLIVALLLVILPVGLILLNTRLSTNVQNTNKLFNLGNSINTSDTSTWKSADFYELLKKAAPHKNPPRVIFKYPKELRLEVQPMVSGVELEEKLKSGSTYRINLSSLEARDLYKWISKNCFQDPAKVELKLLNGVKVYVSSRASGCRQNSVIFPIGNYILFSVEDARLNFEKTSAAEQENMEKLFWSVISTIRMNLEAPEP